MADNMELYNASLIKTPYYIFDTGKWSDEGGGVYKYTGEEVLFKPLLVLENNNEMVEGNLNTLAQGEWCWDNFLLYVRTSNDSNPGGVNMEYSYFHKVMTSTAGVETMIISLTLSNPGNDDAEVVFMITDSTETTAKAIWEIPITKSASVITDPLPQKIVLSPEDRIFLMSSRIDTNIFISYSED